MVTQVDMGIGGVGTALGGMIIRSHGLLPILRWPCNIAWRSRDGRTLYNMVHRVSDTRRSGG